MGFKVAVVGATGNVGREMLDILAERAFPADEVVALASRRSQGTRFPSATRSLKAKTLDTYDFSDIDICLMSAGGEVSKEWSPKIAAQGAVVIDNSSAWRYDADVPLVVPEVNAEAVRDIARRASSPIRTAPPRSSSWRSSRCTTRPRSSASSSRPTSRSPAPARTAWTSSTARPRRSTRCRTSQEKKFPKRIAFNLIPHIDVFMEDGYTKEEWKMMVETKKILDPKIKLTATCVRVPVFIGHSEAVNVEFEKPISADEARDILRSAPGCLVIDKREPGGYITPHEAAGEDATYISRIREDITVENGLAFWCVSDNLRKGAALNAIQIAEAIVNRSCSCQAEGGLRPAFGRVSTLAASTGPEHCGKVSREAKAAPQGLPPFSLPRRRSGFSVQRRIIETRSGDAFHRRLELPGLRIAHQQHAGRDAEIGAVELQLAALDQDAHAGERHQVLEAVLDGGEFERASGIPRDRLARADAVGGRLDQVHPAADEIAGRERRGVVGKGADAAAAGMAQHDDVLHAQRLHREFERRRVAW